MDGRLAPGADATHLITTGQLITIDSAAGTVTITVGEGRTAGGRP
jgi:hypothetical protein